jgi:FkbM family methyltransferase
MTTLCQRRAERRAPWFLPAIVLWLACTTLACRPPGYVLIDGGAHEGETVLAFIRSELYTKHKWEVFAFEPNAELISKIPKGNRVTVLNRALWDRDGQIEFHFSRQGTLGGSVVSSYIPAPEMRTVKVACVDLGQWLARQFKKSDVIYVKLDVEGAEYAILEKMLRDGTIGYVDKLYIEFHGAQQAAAAGEPPEAITAKRRKDYELIEAITGLGIAVSIHEPEEPQGAYFAFSPEKYGQRW